MPYVIVKTKEKYFGPTDDLLLGDIEKHPLRLFTRYLTTIVAGALSVPGTKAELASSEVEVEVREFGKFDVHSADVEIVVFANEYPERLKDLEGRKSKILADVCCWLDDQRGNRPMAIRKVSVWIPLVAGGAYGEFTV